MMNDAKYLRAGTIFAAFSEAGAKVAVITAKDKLRSLLGHQMRGICFSSEKADQVTLAGTAWLTSSIWSHASALGVQRSAVGVRLRRRGQADGTRAPDSCTLDHRLRPAQGRAGTLLANDFYAMMDRYLVQLDALGAAIVVTADHG